MGRDSYEPRPNFILSFSSPEASLDRVGGKGTALATLVRAGFPVPSGFLVTTDAYRAFVEANRLQPRILALVSRTPSEDPRTLEDSSLQIRLLFERGRMPPEMSAEIVSAYRELSESAGAGGGLPSQYARPPVAVRSSATAEDLPGLSFAGQQESYLNVLGEEGVLEAVQRCWGSLWTARAIAYRAHHGIPSDNLALAVVVQKMVAAEASGVLFTANPLTGRRDEMVIDASFGLGEAVVSGRVEPDHYLVRSHQWRILERRLGSKALAVIPRPGGGTEQVALDAGGQQVLAEGQILDLARLGLRVAELFGSPQDIEWAWVDGRFHLLQSRPITALYPLPAVAAPPGELRAYYCLNAVQGVIDPFTPLGLDVLQRLLGDRLRALGVRRPLSEIVPTAGGRIFMDITGEARDPLLRRAVLERLAAADPAASRILRRLIDQGRFPSRRVLAPGPVLALLPGLLSLMGRVVEAVRNPEATRSRVVAEADRILEQSRERAEESRRLAQRLEALDWVLHSLVPRLLALMVPVIAPALVSMALVDRWLVRWLHLPPGSGLRLLRGLSGNVTTEMDLRLWAIAQRIRRESEARESLLARPVEELVAAYRRQRLPPVVQRELGQFLEQYGLRGVAEIDLGRPRWRDDPTPLFQILRGYLRLEDPDLAPDALFRLGAAEAERLAGEYLARIRQTRFGALRARLLEAALRRMRVLGAMRESPKFYLIRILGAHREGLLDSGRQLVEQGRLEHPEDLFFVPLETLERVARGTPQDLRTAVAAERAEYGRERTRRQVPRLLLSTGETFYEGLAEEGAGDLVGDPVSPGVAEGRVRVVLDPRGVRLEPGEVLVCPATDPGWTPLFLTAGALVMEMGGLVTHGSVVAREYGIPAVVGVHRATQRLSTGQRVMVDGNRGRVTVLEEHPGPP